MKIYQKLARQGIAAMRLWCSFFFTVFGCAATSTITFYCNTTLFSIHCFTWIIVE